MTSADALSSVDDRPPLLKLLSFFLFLRNLSLACALGVPELDELTLSTNGLLGDRHWLCAFWTVLKI